MNRIVSLFSFAVALVGMLGLDAQAQTGIAISLDLFYADDSGDNLPDASSKGTWQLYASAGGEGLSTLDVSISGIVGAASNSFAAPYPAYKSTIAGSPTPYDINQDGDPATLDMLFAQNLSTPWDMQYDVGKLGGSTPDVDELGAFVDTSGASMTDAVLLAFGEFGAGSAPVINMGAGLSNANVFTVEGTVSSPPPPGTIIAASPFNGQVRTNLTTLKGDVSLDGVFVDAQDFGILANSFDGGAFASKLWQDGDVTGDNRVDAADIGQVFGSWTGDHPSAGAGSASGQYDPATGEIEVSVNGVVNWYVEYVGGSAMTGDAPIGLPGGAGLVTDNDVRIGESAFAPFSYDLNLGNVAAMGIQDFGNFRIFWNESLGGELQSALLCGLCPEPTTLVLAGMGICGLLAGRRRREG